MAKLDKSKAKEMTGTLISVCLCVYVPLPEVSYCLNRAFPFLAIGVI